MRIGENVLLRVLVESVDTLLVLFAVRKLAIGFGAIDLPLDGWGDAVRSQKLSCSAKGVRDFTTLPGSDMSTIISGQCGAVS